MLSKKKETFYLIAFTLTQMPVMFLHPNTFVLFNIFVGAFPWVFVEKFEDLPYFSYPTISYVFLWFSYQSVKLDNYLSPKWEAFTDRLINKALDKYEARILSQNKKK